MFLDDFVVVSVDGAGNELSTGILLNGVMLMVMMNDINVEIYLFIFGVNVIIIVRMLVFIVYIDILLYSRIGFFVEIISSVGIVMFLGLYFVKL